MSVTLHTNKGDLKIEVFCESVPKTAEVRSGPKIPLRHLPLSRPYHLRENGTQEFPRTLCIELLR